MSDAAATPARKSLAEMAGDTLREAGVLVGALGILDRVVEQRELRPVYVVGVLSTAVVFLGFGFLIERKR